MINRYGFAEMEETNIFIVRNGERSLEAWRAGGFIAIGIAQAGAIKNIGAHSKRFGGLSIAGPAGE